MIRIAAASPLGAPHTLLRDGDSPPLRPYYAALQACQDRVPPVVVVDPTVALVAALGRLQTATLPELA